MTASTPDTPRVSYQPVLITGMSGAGLSTAAKIFEDKGFYVTQNVPPEILVDVIELATAADSPVEKVAAVADVRSRMFQGSLIEAIAELREKNLMPTILFMDASDDVLISRFDSVRRTHPLQGHDTHTDGIARERESIEDLKAMADVIIDTSNLSVHDLRRSIEASFGDMSTDKQHITVQSFGFKHGAPLDADLMVDVRFLPNPFWVPELRGYRGTDEPVSDYVLSRPDALPFVDNFMRLLYSTLEGYRHEGKNYISVAVGCTGGHHRSVAVAEEIGRRLNENPDLQVNVLHRDIKRG